MKVTPPSLSPKRPPTRPQKWSHEANLQNFPLPNPDPYETDPSFPFVCQLFQSLENGTGSPGPPPKRQKAEGHPPMLMLPLPIRSAHKAITPPPSPFPFSKTPPKAKSFATAAATPSSVKTAETESIASFSTYSTPISSAATTPRSSPNSLRPRVSVLGCLPCGNSSRPSSPSAFAHRPPPKPFPNKPKKKPKPTESKTPPRASPSRTSSPSPARSSSKKRMEKVKTELCLYHIAGEPCPFGDNCHYAHGEHELQTKRLLTLQRSGEIENAYTYRIKPCFSHVAMGSCPFGKRCTCIHDPRVTGTVQSWLPITETQGNNIMTDINVEGLHQKRRFDILHGDPFVRESNSPALVDNLHKDYDSETCHSYQWEDLYNMITNHNNHSKKTSRIRRKRGSNSSNRKHQIREVHKASIALQMHGGTHRWMYKYRPSHTIFNEMCMILDKRAFRLDEISGRAIPISLSKYRSSNPNHCIVREIAFGPDGDPSVRPVSLWFNIPGEKVSECTLHKQKLFRWHKHNKSLQPKPTSNNSDGFKIVATSPFESYDSFVMIRPIDREAFFLVKDILEHRYANLKAEIIPSIRERSRALQEVEKEKILLEERFSNLKHHWATWTYPSAAGRPKIDDETPVPPADATYEPGENNPTKYCFRESRKVWTSFLSTLQTFKIDDDDVQDGSTESSSAASYLMGDFRPNTKQETRSKDSNKKRLSVFVELGQGQAINQNNRSLPHIKNKPNCSGDTPQMAKPKESYARQSERCWKSLFFEGDGIHEGEWDAVVNHFTNSSRSQKVLNIVQQ